MTELPPTLSETYRRILLRVPPKQVSLVQMILNFIAYADPKLSTDELRAALSAPAAANASQIMKDSGIIREDAITKLCRSLIRKSTDQRFYEFAHFSVVEYLKDGFMSSSELEPELEPFRISQSICDRLLATQCLNYLQLKNFENFSDIFIVDDDESGHDKYYNYDCARHTSHPFYRYAAIYWPIYARDQWHEASVFKPAMYLFGERTGAFRSWVTAWIVYATRSNDKKDVQQLRDALDLAMHPNLTPLHMAATLSLPEICRRLLETGADINSNSPMGTPLQCAVQVVFGILDQVTKLHVDSEVWEGFDAFYCPRWDGKPLPPQSTVDTVKYLLDAGATHNMQQMLGLPNGSLFALAFWVATYTRDFFVASILVDGGVRIEEADLIPLQELLEWLQDYPLDGDCGGLISIIGMKRLMQAFMIQVDKSPLHWRMYKVIWECAIALDCEFASDPLIVDSRVCFTDTFLRQQLVTAVRRGKLELITKILEDPRFGESGLVGPSGESLYGVLAEADENLENPLAIFKAFLDAGSHDSVSKPDEKGLLPVHHLAQTYEWHLFKDESSYQTLEEIVHELVGSGVGCNLLTPNGSTALHLCVRFESDAVLKVLLELDTEENVSMALQTQDETGETPLSLAIAQRREHIALALLERAIGLPGTLQDSTRLLSLCVTTNSQPIFEALLQAGVDDATNTQESILLHNLGRRTSVDFVETLIARYPQALACRIKGKIPLDIYLEQCLRTEHKPHSGITEALAPRKALSTRQRMQSWQHFISTVNKIRKEDETKSSEIGQVVSSVVFALQNLGFVESCEAITHAQNPAILTMLEGVLNSANQCDLDALWPLLPDAVCEVVKNTSGQCWETLKDSSVILRLMKASAASFDLELVGLLLERGVSVHQRVDNLSVLEHACLDTGPFDARSRKIFTLLMDNIDQSRLDEVNPHDQKRRGLIHFLASSRYKAFRVIELLKRGADANLRRGDWNSMPALVEHILAEDAESALILLRNGADPNQADRRGVNAALAAAFNGMVSFLNNLYNIENVKWKKIWCNTCGFWIEVDGNARYLHSANALHVSASRGQVDSLRFYIGRKILTNINETTSGDLFTPMHLAALGGRLDVAKLLLAHGADVNLKTNDGSLPLHFAVRNGHLELVKLLVYHTAKGAVDFRGMSSLAYARRARNNDAITELLSNTEIYQPIIALGVQHVTKEVIQSFKKALLDQDLELCKELLSLGCSPDAELTSSGSGTTPLALAIKYKKMKAINWLLKQNASTIRHLQTLPPIVAMMKRSQYGNILPTMLEHFHREGGSVLDEQYNLIITAVRSRNNNGLALLFKHAQKHELVDG